jgi:hypothetical protein
MPQPSQPRKILKSSSGYLLDSQRDSNPLLYLNRITLHSTVSTTTTTTTTSSCKLIQLSAINTMARLTLSLFLVVSALAGITQASPIQPTGTCQLNPLTAGEIERTTAQGGCISFESNTLEAYRACELFTEPLSEWDCHKWQAIAEEHRDEWESSTDVEEGLEKRIPCSGCPARCAFARGTGLASIGLWSACMGTCAATCT